MCPLGKKKSDLCFKEKQMNFFLKYLGMYINKYINIHCQFKLSKELRLKCGLHSFIGYIDLREAYTSYRYGTKSIVRFDPYGK